VSAPSALGVVVPSFEGAGRVGRLLAQLGRQTLAPERFEVVVVDDGSKTPLSEVLDPCGHPFGLRVLWQPNGGAAAARHRGALATEAPLLVFIDDDMEVEPDFLQAHLRAHQDGRPKVVLGRMRGPAGGVPGLFERWHQTHLDRKAATLRQGGLIPGKMLFSGNVSMRRCDYLAVGGFDPSLRRGHDAELGLRLQKHGVPFVFCEQAFSRHGPEDHPLQWWRERAALYGRVDQRIWSKHPDIPQASPWQLARQMSPLARPFIALAVHAPQAAGWLAERVLRAAMVLDGAGQQALALKVVTLGYTLDYFRGLRLELGSTRRALQEAQKVGLAPARAVS
jgi:GT2 family glycosyltransferase